MPSVSKSQQRLMGQAYAYKKGELKSSEVSAEIKELADNMTLKQLKDFASTKHDGLPETVDEFVTEKRSDLWSPYQKADILAGDMFGAMGLYRLSDDELNQIIDLKKADKLAKKQFGEFGFKTLAAKEMEELLDANPKLLREAFIGPFVFNDSMSDEELLGMYNGALDGYANHAKGMRYAKSDYKKAYQEIEKILKKRGAAVDENLAPGSLNGMGPVTLPAGETLGSGDVPAGSGDAEEEYKKKKRKPGVELMTFEKFTKTNMKHINTFEAFTFDYQDTDIRNPFTDETARMDVDPDGYYGKDYAKSDIKKIVDATENFIAKYTEWKDYAPLDADEDLHADYGDYVKPSLDELVRIVKKHG